ncbi:PIN domain-containing protein [Butyrivibrio sp. AC2005]|uniref:PIN domain-containing protein n=1 Tax=Butyrivibrio sp. AC2005 TaxID=1280672 RepID=UPI00040F729B|nr:PIN domain-containing protein [Butyrivibrio sp. AC2005]
MAIKIFLDTSVYDNLNFSFNNRQLSKLRDLAQNGEIDLLYNEIVYQEVYHNISENLSVAINQYNQLLMDSRALAPFKHDDSLSVKISSLDSDKMINEIRANWDKFLNECIAEKIDINTVDVDEIVNKYFKRLLPFENKKPYEFKDAIIIDSIRQYASCNPREEIYVVSKDKGFRKSFRDDKQIVVFAELYDAINQAIRSEENLPIELENLFNEDDFNTAIRATIDTYTTGGSVSVEDIFDEVDVISSECTDLEFEYVDDVNDENATIIATATIEFVVEYSERDEDRSYYDQEDDRYYWEVYNKFRNKFSVTKEVEIIVIFNTDSKNPDDLFGSAEVTIDDDFYLEKNNLLESELLETTSDESEDEEDDDYDPTALYCPDCGCKITYANDGGAFCTKCAPNH